MISENAKKKYIGRKSRRIIAAVLAMAISISVFVQTLPGVRAESSDSVEYAEEAVVTVEVSEPETDGNGSIDMTVSLEPDAEAQPDEAAQPEADKAAEPTEEDVSEAADESADSDAQNDTEVSVDESETAAEADTAAETDGEEAETEEPEIDRQTQAVIDAIAQLPEPEEVEGMSEAEKTKAGRKVYSARTRFDKLSDEQKALVTGLEKLETLEELLAEFIPASMMMLGATQQYDITIADTEHGSVSVVGNIAKAEADTEITLSAAADTGYAFKSWSVTDADSQPVEVSGDKFIMPAKNVTVSASFCEPLAQGTVQTDVSWYITDDGELIIYPTNGTSGTINGSKFSSSSSWLAKKNDIKSITVRPGVKLSGSARQMFAGLANCTAIDMRNLDVSACTNMQQMFWNCSSLASVDVSTWDTSKVTNMSSMFNGCKALTDIDVSGFNTGNVQATASMFYNCGQLTALDVSKWDVSKLSNMNGMFSTCSSLTTLDVSKWNTASVTDMGSVFSGCGKINGIDVSNWNTSSVTNMGSLFNKCTSLTSVDVSKWNTANVQTMSYMFANCSNLKEIDVSKWKTDNVTTMHEMFSGCKSLESIEVGDFNTSKVTSTESMFYGCDKLTAIDVSDWDMSSVTSMRRMFYGCGNLAALDVSDWNTPANKSLDGTFFGCSKLEKLEVGDWDTSKVETLNNAFWGCSTLTELDVSGWNTESLKIAAAAFRECSNIEVFDVSGWDTSNVTDMQSMFHKCDSLEKIDASNWDTSNVTNMNDMFYNCSSLHELDAENWDITNVDKMNSIFDGCSNLAIINVDPDFDFKGYDGADKINTVTVKDDRLCYKAHTPYEVYSVVIHQNGKDDISVDLKEWPEYWEKFDADTMTATVRFSAPHKVIVADGIVNGTIKPDLLVEGIAYEDDIVPVIVKPDKGYILDTLEVKDAKAKSVKVTGNSFVMPTSDATVYATFIEHTHSFVYGAKDNVLKAWCDTEDTRCHYCGEEKALPLTLAAPTGCVYDGTTSYPAVISDAEKAAWTAEGLTVPTIMYKKGTADATADAPVNAGEYTASITAGGKTASVTFTVAKADAEIQNLSDLDDVPFGSISKLAGTCTSGAAVSYEVKEGTSVETASDGTLTFKGLGKTTIKATAPETDNYKAAEKEFYIHVIKGDMTLTAEKSEIELVYGDDTSVVGLAKDGSKTVESAVLTYSMDDKYSAYVTVDEKTGKLTFVSETTTEPYPTVEITAVSPYYNDPAPMTVTIKTKRKPLTIAADDKEMRVGKPLPELTYTATGFVGNDESKLPDGFAPVPESKFDRNVPGEYKLSFEGVSVGDYITARYDLTDGLIDGTLTVLPKRNQMVYVPNREITIFETDSGYVIDAKAEEAAAPGESALLDPKLLGTLIFSSSDKSVVSIDGKGVLKVGVPGTAEITVYAAANLDYAQSEPVTVKVNVEKLRVIEGMESTYSKLKKVPLQFRANGPYDKFVKLQVDGKDVASADYTAWSGSTYVKFTAKYLDKLSVGKHRLTFVYVENRTCGCDFYVTAPSGGSGDIPKTGDGRNLAVWANLLLVSVLTVAIIVIEREKKGVSQQ